VARNLWLTSSLFRANLLVSGLGMLFGK